MASFITKPTVAFTLLATLATTTLAWDVKPFEINVPAEKIAHTKQLVQLTHLPSPQEFQGGGWEYGIPLDYLNELRDDYLGEYNWTKEQSKLNRYEKRLIEWYKLLMMSFTLATSSTQSK
jgi:hypothetical protein